MELLPLTVPEIRWLLYHLVWLPDFDAQQILSWSRWRRKHQARARLGHIKRRAKRLAA